MSELLTMERIRESESAVNKIARTDFYSFVRLMNPQYGVDGFKWFHKLIAHQLQRVYEGKIQRLMLFVPPQHAKSTLASQMFPAWILGQNPKTKIVGSSYSSDLAQAFSRSIQRTIDSPEYHKIFPETFLNNSNVRTDSKQGFLRNADLFETVGHGGFYKAVGVCGSLTGTPADIALIDDPVKDALEAYSQTYRERVWDWYVNVLRTRLHNDSRIVLIMTRWHQDDLAGRILEDMKKGGDKWEIFCLPAIKEGAKTSIDPRNEGEALWPEKHSAEKILQTKRMSLKVFNSLYQQRPSAVEGSIFKYAWFNKFTLESLKEKERLSGEPIVWNFVGDTAYENKEINDPSAFIAFCHYKNDLYILDVARVYKQMPELIRFTKDFVRRNQYSPSSSVKIEPKASGKSLVQMLKNETGLNIMQGIAPTKDKKARAEVCVPFVESGRVYLLEGAAWVDMFLDEVCSFPNGKHDDIVDCFTMAINELNSLPQGFFGFSTIG